MATEAVYSYDSIGRLTSINFSNGAMSYFAYDDSGNRTCTFEAAAGSGCLMKFNIYTKNGNFTASDGAGSYYRITATATVTMPLSPADGSVYKFKVTSGTATFVFDGAETINHANGVSDQNLILTSNTGVLELIAVTNGWDET
jgi:YD repeat-containing protein